MRFTRATLAAAVCIAITTVSDSAISTAQAKVPAPVVTNMKQTSGVSSPGVRTAALDLSTPAAASLTDADRSFLNSSWPQVWRDDFSGNTLSSAWQHCYPWQTCTNESNNESQWYQAKNATVANGLLHLTARREAVKGRFPNGRTQQFPYSSAMVQTSNSFAARTGRIEVRAKSVAGKAIWPALWLLPTDQSWPPEIDFFEQFGSSKHFEQTLHTGSDRKAQFNQDGVDTTADFHTYGVQWKADLTVMTMDGRVTGVSHTPHADKPLYLLMNQAVGGNWVGSPNASTPAKSDFQIDSVTAYGPAGANVLAR